MRMVEMQWNDVTDASNIDSKWLSTYCSEPYMSKKYKARHRLAHALASHKATVTSSFTLPTHLQATVNMSHKVSFHVYLQADFLQH